MDWRDADDLRRPNGAEAADYQGTGSKVVPANAPFETIGEVARVLGMTPAIYSRIVGSVTVYSRQAGVNPLTASREVLLALPNADASVVDAYVASREEALRAGTPPPPYAGAGGMTVRRDPDLARSRAGEPARWCNLRPRSGAAVLARSGEAARRACLARRRARAGRCRRQNRREPCRPTVASRWARSPRRWPGSRSAPARPASCAGGPPSSRRSCPRRRAARSRAAGCARSWRSAATPPRSGGR